MTRLAEYRKALVALGGALGYIVNLGVLHGTAQVVVGVVLAALTSLGVVGVSNAPTKTDPQAGSADVVLLLMIGTFIGVLLLLLFGVHFR